MLFVALGQHEIGRRIAEARESAGFTQQQLAEEIGLKHAQQISKYERGKAEVPTRRLHKIATVTKRPISFFVGDTPAGPAAAEATDQLVNVPVEQLAALIAELRALREQVDGMTTLMQRLVPPSEEAAA